jgi:hypothetical protein
MPLTASTAQSLMAFWAGLHAHTQFFLLAIVCLTAFFHIRFTRQAVAYGPTILTTTGIFATFVGVAQGLSGFDTANVQSSVPSLLAGLKTAFWASVAGVGGALTLKFRDYFLGPTGQQHQQQPEALSGAELPSLLGQIHRALVGTEEGSLISQLKLSRQDTNDRLDALKAAQTEALAKLSEMGSKTLVEALRDVIKDFNQKISEQFGSNFAELNIAVGRLLTWQQQYKEHVERSVAKLDEISRVTNQAVQDYAEIVEQSRAFSSVAQDVHNLLTGLKDEQRQLSSLSQDLAKLLTSASGSLPEIEKRVLELTNQLARAVTENQMTVSKTLTDNTAAIRNTVQAVHDGLTFASTENNKQLAELVSKTKEQVAVLDAALAEELQKSLQSLGRQLAALSEKFVSDYSPLTDKLHRLVHMAS